MLAKELATMKSSLKEKLKFQVLLFFCCLSFGVLALQEILPRSLLIEVEMRLLNSYSIQQLS